MVSTHTANNLPKIHLTILRRFFQGAMARQNITKMPNSMSTKAPSKAG